MGMVGIKLIAATLLGIASVGTAAAQGVAGPSNNKDPLSLIAGDWEVVNVHTGKALQDCAHAQSFNVSPDRTHVLLTDHGNKPRSFNYLVIWDDPTRLLTYIENEDRLDDQGDPVLWWAYFDGPNKFRWRRYDWSRGAMTVAEWRRCEV